MVFIITDVPGHAIPFKLLQKRVGIVWVYCTISLPLRFVTVLKMQKHLLIWMLKISSFSAVGFDVRYKFT